MLTAPFGVAYIETRFEALIGAYAAAQLAAEHHERFDAVIVAAFGDPGLGGLREALPVPGHRAHRSGAGQRLPARPALLDRRDLAAHPRLVPRGGGGVRPRTAGWRASARSTGRWPDIGSVQDDQGRAPARAGGPLRRRGRCRRDRARRRAAGRAWRAACAASCRCRWSTACRARCATPRRWWRCSPAARARGSFAPPPVKPNRGLPPAIARCWSEAARHDRMPLRPAASPCPRGARRPRQFSFLPVPSHPSGEPDAAVAVSPRSPPPHSPRRSSCQPRRRRSASSSRPSASRWPPA